MAGSAAEGETVPAGEAEVTEAGVGAMAGVVSGSALLIDYGRDRLETGDTLQALARHQKVDPLAAPPLPAVLPTPDA